MVRTRTDIEIIKFSLIAVLISMSGWMVFRGVEQIFNLRELEPITLVITGLTLGFILVKLGLKKQR